MNINPDVNYGLQLIPMYQYWLMNCNKCTTLLKMLIIGEQGKENTGERYVTTVLYAVFL